jgi:hypothetical protein
MVGTMIVQCFLCNHPHFYQQRIEVQNPLAGFVPNLDCHPQSHVKSFDPRVPSDMISV